MEKVGGTTNEAFVIFSHYLHCRNAEKPEFGYYMMAAAVTYERAECGFHIFTENVSFHPLHVIWREYVKGVNTVFSEI